MIKAKDIIEKIKEQNKAILVELEKLIDECIDKTSLHYDFCVSYPLSPEQTRIMYEMKQAYENNGWKVDLNYDDDKSRYDFVIYLPKEKE